MTTNNTGIDWRKEERVQVWLNKHVDPASQDGFMDDADSLLDEVAQIALAKARERVEDLDRYDGFLTVSGSSVSIEYRKQENGIWVDIYSLLAALSPQTDGE